MPTIGENGKIAFMQRWLWLVFIVGSSCFVLAQQNPAPPSPPPAASDKDASGLSRDMTFPEDDPAQPAAAKDAPANNPANNAAAKKQTSSLAPPHSDRVQVDDLGPATGESSSKDTQVDLSPPVD